jgi:hypothetical protein
MDMLKTSAELLEPLVQRFGLGCSVLFSSAVHFAESDSNVYDIYSATLERSLVLKEQRIGKRGAEQVRCCCIGGVTAGLVSSVLVSLSVELRGKSMLYIDNDVQHLQRQWRVSDWAVSTAQQTAAAAGNCMVCRAAEQTAGPISANRFSSEPVSVCCVRCYS